MFLFLPHRTLDIFTIGKRVNHGGEYGLEIPVNFYFYGLEKAIKLAKKIKKTMIEGKLNEILKHSLK